MTIDVVIPAYQVEAWLERCLRSVLEQDTPADEIIVVDDGSTDGTADIAGSYEGVTLVRQPNQRLAGARNTGTRTSHADWIFYLDADDILLPGAIAAFHTAISEWPNASVIDPAYESEYPDGHIERPLEEPARAFGRGQLVEVLWRNPFAANALIRRDVAERYPYDAAFHPCEDLNLWCRLLLDSHEIVRMGRASTRRSIGRAGALSNRVLVMRRARLAVFRAAWRDHRLSVAERAMLVYQIPRVSTGITVARVLNRGS